MWLYILLLITTFVWVFGASLMSGGSRIIGGVDVEPGEYPYMVSLQSSGTHFCGGTIASENVIITSAQCVENKTASSISVVSGTTSLSEGGNSHAVAEIIIHEGYKPTDSWRNDIAILKLTAPITFGDFEKAVPLPEQGESPGGGNSYGIALGWGYTQYPEPSMSDKLQKVMQKLVSHDGCNAIHSINVYLTNMCAGITGGEGICNGDFGGPFIAGGKQVGIASWNRPCAGDFGGPFIAGGKQVGIASWNRPCAVSVADVYTRVASYKEWISVNSD